MPISQQEVEHIAQLARLGLSEAETAKMQKEMAVILDYINQLKEADVSGIEDDKTKTFLNNIWRGDDVKSESQKDVAIMLNQAPEREGEWLKVKEVLT